MQSACTVYTFCYRQLTTDREISKSHLTASRIINEQRTQAKRDTFFLGKRCATKFELKCLYNSNWQQLMAGENSLWKGGQCWHCKQLRENIAGFSPRVDLNTAWLPAPVFWQFGFYNLNLQMFLWKRYKTKEGCKWGHGLSAAIKLGSLEKTVGASLFALWCVLISPVFVEKTALHNLFPS